VKVPAPQQPPLGNIAPVEMTKAAFLALGHREMEAEVELDLHDQNPFFVYTGWTDTVNAAAGRSEAFCLSLNTNVRTQEEDAIVQVCTQFVEESILLLKTNSHDS